MHTYIQYIRRFAPFCVFELQGKQVYYIENNLLFNLLHVTVIVLGYEVLIREYDNMHIIIR